MKLVVLSVGVVGAAVAVLGVSGSHGLAIDPGARGLAAVLVALLLLSEMWPVQRHVGALEFTASWAFAGALGLVAPPVWALAALAVGSVVGDALARKARSRVLYNAAALVVSLGLGLGVLDAMDARTTLLDDGTAPAWFVLACVVFALVVFAANLLLVALMVHVETGLGVRRFVRRILPQSALDDLLLLAWAPVVAVAGLRSELLIAMPMLGVAVTHRRLRDYAKVHWPAFSLSDVLDHAELVRHIRATARRGVTVVLVELPSLREIRSRIGARGEEQLTQAIDGRLRAAVPQTAVVFRSRADRFTIALDGTGSDVEAEVERVTAVFDRSIDVVGVPVSVPALFGQASASGTGADPEVLLEAAAYHLLGERRAASSSVAVRVADDEGTSGFTILYDLREAMRDEELVVEYQPQVSLATGDTVGFEALIRWRHPDGTTTMPADFVYAAEQTDLIGELTSFVLRESLATCERWWRAGHRIPVSVNVSVRSLTDPSFVDTVRLALIEHRLPGAALEVEYTESALLHDLAGAKQTLDDLARFGVAVAIDDFGTGYSSFEHLRLLPISRLKIDRSFVGEGDGLDPRFVAPMIVLGHNLDLSVVAEGVEDAHDCETLRELGCDAAQGWLFARSMPASATLEWLNPRMHAASGA